MLVSVIIPCYRQAHFLPEAVESVVAQTSRRWECVIVDDGSPDDTEAVALALARRYPRRKIRLLRQPNRGVHAARNAGIAASKGELVLPLDADDRLDPCFLSRCRGLFRKDPSLDIVCSDMLLFGEQRGEVSFPASPLAEVCRRNTMPVSSVHRRALWRRVKGYQAHALGYEDWDYWLAALACGARAARIARPLFHYRVRSDGALASARSNRDSWLKARIIAARHTLFSTTQRLWAAEILRHADLDHDCPPLAGQSFARVGEIPADGEALADLGSMAFWAADTPWALSCWLSALRGADLTAAGRASVLCVVRELGLEAELRRLAAASSE